MGPVADEEQAEHRRLSEVCRAPGAGFFRGTAEIRRVPAGKTEKFHPGWVAEDHPADHL